MISQIVLNNSILIPKFLVYICIFSEKIPNRQFMPLDAFIPFRLLHRADSRQFYSVGPTRDLSTQSLLAKNGICAKLE